MKTILTKAIFLLALNPVYVVGGPVEPRQQSRWNPFVPCNGCLRTAWTQGPECTTDPNLKATISRVLNPPASETATYTPSEWCSKYLHQTDWSTQWQTTSLVNTYTSWTIEHFYVTTTDYDHPTSTLLCPIPSPSMECGWDSNTIAPIDQQEDFSIEHFQTPEQCQQICLQRSACRAYRIDGNTTADTAVYCEIFNLGLGVNASHVRNPTPGGSQWWDRNCQMHVPKPCRGRGSGSGGPTRTTNGTTSTSVGPPVLTTETASYPGTATVNISTTTTGALAPSITPPARLAKRDAPFPPYLEDLSYAWSSVYMVPACSCVVSFAGEPQLVTTTKTATEWTAYTTVTSTYEDWFTVTETPRQTSVYLSVD